MPFAADKQRAILIKAVSILLIAVLVVNLVLFAMGRLEMSRFWVIVIITAIIAYIVLPVARKGTIEKK